MRSPHSGKGCHGYQEGKLVRTCSGQRLCNSSNWLLYYCCWAVLLQMEPLHDRVLIKPIEEEPVRAAILTAEPSRARQDDARMQYI